MVTVYQCLEGGVIAVLQSYIDEDKDESFYTVSWACNIDGTPFLVAGGLNGIIRVIDTGNEKIYKKYNAKCYGWSFPVSSEERSVRAMLRPWPFYCFF
ncbi:Polycomb group protein fie2 [Orobanche hederae]